MPVRYDRAGGLSPAQRLLERSLRNARGGAFRYRATLVRGGVHYRVPARPLLRLGVGIRRVTAAIENVVRTMGQDWRMV
jgi:hypothetical protein